MTSQYQDLVQSAATASSAAFVTRVVRDFAERVGYELFSATCVLPLRGGGQQFLCLHEMPADYLAAFHDTPSAQIDPVMQHCKNQYSPISWSRATYVEAKRLEKWEEMAAHGLSTGVAVAQHLPNGRHLIVGFDRRGPPPEGDQLDNTLGGLQLLSSMLVEPMLKLFDKSRPSNESIRLTSLEKECLSWAMEGKTSFETAAILRLSQSRVSKVLSAALQKLDAVTKTQAVVKALQLSLI